MAIKEIRIEFVDPARTPHIYRLGLGPCGRVVVELRVLRDDHETAIEQTVEEEEDGPATFVYPFRHILRVAVYEYDPGVCPLEV